MQINLKYQNAAKKIMNPRAKPQKCPVCLCKYTYFKDNFMLQDLDCTTTLRPKVCRDPYSKMGN